MSIGIVGLLGFMAEGMGLLAGVLLLYLFHIKNQRVIGMLFGGTSGLMMAMICFDVLPEALDKNRIDLVFVGIIIGVLLGLLLDDLVPNVQRRFKMQENAMSRTALILTLGIALHNIPEGFALGTLASANMGNISKFAFVMALHSIPEGIALAIPYKEAGMKLGKMVLLPLFLGCAMSIGAILGFMLTSLSEGLVIIALGVASGVILYIVCEELMPESKKIWNGRLTTVATILGLMLGIVLLCY